MASAAGVKIAGSFCFGCGNAGLDIIMTDFGGGVFPLNVITNRAGVFIAANFFAGSGNLFHGVFMPESLHLYFLVEIATACAVIGGIAGLFAGNLNVLALFIGVSVGRAFCVNVVKLVKVFDNNKVAHIKASVVPACILNPVAVTFVSYALLDLKERKSSKGEIKVEATI